MVVVASVLVVPKIKYIYKVYSLRSHLFLEPPRTETFCVVCHPKTEVEICLQISCSCLELWWELRAVITILIDISMEIVAYCAIIHKRNMLHHH
jgi:hypothetical protein